MVALDARDAVEQLSPLYWVGIGLALVTGLVHLVLGLANVRDPLGLAFVLAGLGFFGGITLVVVDYWRRLVVLAGIPFTAAQIVGWYALNQPAGVADLTPVEAIDKTVQTLLIAVLVVLSARES